MGAVGRVISNGVHVWLGGGTPESRLVRWTTDGELMELRADVERFEVDSYPERALVANAEAGFDVLAVEGSDEPHTIAERAIDLGKSSGSSTLLGHDVEQNVGTLRYTSREQGTVADVADEVFLRSARFSFDAGTILYLDRYDLESATGRLCVKITETADEFCEASVSDFRRTIRPERGVAYVKSRSGQRRLFWASME